MKAAGAGLGRGNVLPVQSPFLSSREAAKSRFAQAACIGYLRSPGCALRNPSGKGAETDEPTRWCSKTQGHSPLFTQYLFYIKPPELRSSFPNHLPTPEAQTPPQDPGSPQPHNNPRQPAGRTPPPVPAAAAQPRAKGGERARPHRSAPSQAEPS